MGMAVPDLTVVDVLLDGEWHSAHVRLQAGTSEHPMTLVHLLEPCDGEEIAVVASDHLRPHLGVV